MGQHRSIKVSAAEHLRDVSEMPADLGAAFRAAGVICGYFNRAAVRRKPKAMRRFLMRKSHRHIAALVDLRQMIVVSLDAFDLSNCYFRSAFEWKVAKHKPQTKLSKPIRLQKTPLFLFSFDPCFIIYFIIYLKIFRREF